MDRKRLTLCPFNLQLAPNGLNASWLITYIGKIERHFEPVIIAQAIFVSFSCCLGTNYIVFFLEGPLRMSLFSVSYTNMVKAPDTWLFQTINLLLLPLK